MVDQALYDLYVLSKIMHTLDNDSQFPSDLEISSYQSSADYHLLAQYQSDVF